MKKCIICGDEAVFVVEISYKNEVLCDLDDESDEAGFGLCANHGACVLNVVENLFPVEWVKFTY